MKTNKTTRIAVAGVMAALSVVLLLLNLLIPMGTVALTATSAVILFFLVLEYGYKTALAVYAVTAVLCAILLTGIPEVFCLYVFIFGLFSLLKKPLDRIRSVALRYTLKLLFAVFSALLYGALMIFLLQAEVLSDYITKTLWLDIVTVLLYLATFLLYDECLTRLARLYYRSLRQKLFPNQK